jgi:hypothetical protein
MLYSPRRSHKKSRERIREKSRKKIETTRNANPVLKPYTAASSGHQSEYKR